MKEIKVKSGGVYYAINVPETVEEFDQLAKREGAALASAIDNVIYRSANAQFRSEFADLVEKETGIERKTKVSGTREVEDEEGNKTEEDIVVYDESEGKYLNRVYAELDLELEEQRQARFQEQIEQAAEDIKFDPSERQAATKKPKKARKEYRETAEAILEAGGEEGLAKTAAKLSDMLGYEVEATLEAVALGIQINETKDVDERASKYLS
jgi:hypothetical protein